eukprot:g30806.t1
MGHRASVVRASDSPSSAVGGRTVLNCDGHVDNLKAALAMYASYFLLFAHFFAERYIYPPSPKKKTA